MESAYHLRAVVVLYHPDDDAIAMIREIAHNGYAPVAIVNAIDLGRLNVLRHAGVETLVNDTNVGLSVAFNQGIERALASGASHVMLLDQDTRPPTDMAARLLALAARFEKSKRKLGCIGPVPVDRKQPAARTLARRTADNCHDPDLVEVTTIISSGMVIPRTALEAVGAMWNELFIDQIDHEWCFRARAAGLAVVSALSITMPHDMGDAGFRLLGRYKPVHRSPVRHFHIIRNTLWLARCSFIPAPWRIIETAKLAVRVPAYLLFSSARKHTLLAMWRGMMAGLRPPPGRTLTASPTIRTGQFTS